MSKFKLRTKIMHLEVALSHRSICTSHENKNLSTYTLLFYT